MTRDPARPAAAGSAHLDPVDVAIIRALQVDGRMPFVRVAERAQVSERTVRRKFHRLAREGVLRVVAVANPITMGYTCPTILGIQCRLTRIERVMQELCNLRQLRFVGLASGRHDIVAEGYFPTPADLYEFRSNVLHRIDGVDDSRVAIVLRIEKQTYLWGLDPGSGGAQGSATAEMLTPAGPEHRGRLTDLDRAIIEELQRDGRMAYADLAARTGAAQVTVTRRVEQLLRDGIIRVVAVVDPFRLGFHSPAVIGLTLDLDRQPEVLRELRDNPRLSYVAATTGEFDAVVVGYFSDNQDLARFVVKDLAQVPGIRRVNTSILFDIAKQAYDWGTVAPSH